MLLILFCMTHLIRVSFEWFTVLLCFLVVEVSNGDFVKSYERTLKSKNLMEQTDSCLQTFFSLTLQNI